MKTYEMADAFGRGTLSSRGNTGGKTSLYQNSKTIIRPKAEFSNYS